MKKRVLLAMLAAVPIGAAQTQPPAEMPRDPSFAAFLPQWEAAQTRFISGDPVSWKQHASHRPDVTIFGAFGGSEKGWSAVGPRNDWASAQFKDSGARQTIEYLNSGASGELAFTISIERQVAQIAGQPNPTRRALRVTQVFRKEGNEWKLLHRHADPLVERLPPSERR